MSKIFQSTRFRILFALVLSCVSFTKAGALEGLYVGGHVGHVALTGNLSNTYSNSIGFGLDLGLQVNPVLDLMFQTQLSPHSGPIESLKVLSNTLDASFHLGQFNDFDFTLQGGPGFYSYSGYNLSETKFGLNFGAGVDVLADEYLRVGLDWRYHLLLGSGSSNFNFWSIMMRVGYWFGSN